MEVKSLSLSLSPLFSPLSLSPLSSILTLTTSPRSLVSKSTVVSDVSAMRVSAKKTAPRRPCAPAMSNFRL